MIANPNGSHPLEALISSIVFRSLFYNQIGLMFYAVPTPFYIVVRTVRDKRNTLFVNTNENAKSTKDKTIDLFSKSLQIRWNHHRNSIRNGHRMEPNRLSKIHLFHVFNGVGWCFVGSRYFTALSNTRVHCHEQCEHRLQAPPISLRFQ